MSSDSLVCAMLAVRQACREMNPDLQLWAKRRWEAWRSSEKRRTDCSPKRLVVVAAITCVDDLLLHIGLMQLLGVAGLHATVVVTLPTAESARLVRAQARRDAWEMLVHILVKGECDEKLRDLPPGEPLVVFPAPAILSAEASGAIALMAQGSIRALEDVPTGQYFIGSAADYAVWSTTTADSLDESLSAMAREILLLDSKQLGPPALGAEGSGAEVMETRAERNWDLDGRAIVIPQFGSSDELIISTRCKNGALAKIAHQSGHFCDLSGDLPVRAPATMLTTDPQRIRVEVRAADKQVSTMDFLFQVPPSDLKPWMLSAFLNRGGAGNPVIRAFAEAVGCRIAYAEDEPEILRDIPVVWGVLRGSDRILAAAKAQQLYFFYIDHAYFDRGHGRNYRITRNAYEAGPIRRCPGDRLQALKVDVTPWRKGGREIIVCPPTDYFMRAHGCEDWLESALATLRSVTDRPIIVRQKPKLGENILPLSEALSTAHALVTHSSNVAIEAACLGTPVFVAATSAAAPVGQTDLTEIESPIYPDRTPWLRHLAHNQFSYDEIRDGTAWRLLLQLEGRELV